VSRRACPRACSRRSSHPWHLTANGSARSRRSAIAGVEPIEGDVDFGQCLRSHLEHRELDVALDVGIGHVDRITHVIGLVAAPVAHPTQDVVAHFLLARRQHLSQVRIPHVVGHRRLPRHRSMRERTPEHLSNCAHPTGACG
jgi:hypothetical protein